MVCLFCHHDSDFDFERGRIVIPHERLRAPDPSDPKSGLYLMTCIRGHKDTAQNPHGWTCPECRKENSDLRVPAYSATRARSRVGRLLDPLAEAPKQVDPNQFMNQNELVEIN